MKRRTKKILVIVSWLPILILVIYIYLSREKRKEYLSEEIGYSIGTIEKYQDLPRSPAEFIYTFKIENVNYEGTYFLTREFIVLSTDSLHNYEGMKYKIRYSVKKPKFSELLIEQPIK